MQFGFNILKTKHYFLKKFSGKTISWFKTSVVIKYAGVKYFTQMHIISKMVLNISKENYLLFCVKLNDMK